MRKLNLRLFTFLLAVALILLGKHYSRASLPDFLSQNPRAETRSQKQSLPWGELFKKIPPREKRDPPAGSRGDFCPIAPAVPVEIGVIWSDRPLFLWRGKAGRIEVRQQGSQQVLWSQRITEGQSSVVYGGEALQPDTYDWVSFDERAHPQMRVTFQVMAGEERDRMKADLSRLEMQLKQEGATTEKIAYARANYFVERQMWADVLREAYAVKHPSEDLTKFILTVPERFCPLARAMPK